mgnify:CR=1 FL=1
MQEELQLAARIDTAAKQISVGDAPAWSRRTGERDDDYALYLDVQHDDGSWSYGHALPFDVGSHDWQLRDRVLQLARPVKSVTVH